MWLERERVQAALAAALLAAAFSAAGCGASPAGVRAPKPRPPLAGKRYSVVAPLLHVPRAGRTLACFAVLTSYPPAGCSGVPVAGIRRPAGVHRVGTTWWTGPLLLVGVWDGHVLQVTRPPVPSAPRRDPTPPSGCDGQREAAAARTVGARLAALHESVGLLTLVPCSRRVWALVAAADPATLAEIHHRFGDLVMVHGWLQPYRPAR
jgi:hypothetical protein